MQHAGSTRFYIVELPHQHASTTKISSIRLSARKWCSYSRIHADHSILTERSYSKLPPQRSIGCWRLETSTNNVDRGQNRHYKHLPAEEVCVHRYNLRSVYCRRLMTSTDPSESGQNDWIPPLAFEGPQNFKHIVKRWASFQD